MKSEFNDILVQIQNEGYVLCNELKKRGGQISQSECIMDNRSIQQQTKKQSFFTNGKAFIIIGVCVLLVTLFSMFSIPKREDLSSEDSIPVVYYLLLIISFVFIVYGFRNMKSIKPVESSIINFNKIEIKYVDEMSALISDIADKWEVFMTSKKKELQELINYSELEIDEKNNALSHTYYVELINKSCYELIKEMRLIEKDKDFKINADKAIADFIKQSETKILDVVTRQQDNYRKIIL